MQLLLQGTGLFKRKKWNYRFNCPYHLCPSNQPFRNAHKPKMKYIQNVSPSTTQYKCLDCGCLTNVCIEDMDNNKDLVDKTPSLIFGRYK